MYTQCPECAVVLTISANDLRAADGEVCCGACNHVFNAVHHLVDTDEELLPDDLNPEKIEIETDDSEPTTDSPITEANTSESTEDTASEEPPDEESIAWSRTIAALGLADEATLKALAQHDETEVEDDERDQELELNPAPDPISDTGSFAKPSDGQVFEFVEEVEEPDLGNFDPDELLNEQSHSPWLQRGLWLSILVAGVVLLVQVVHFQRNELAIDSRWGNTVQKLYARLGIPLDPNWDVKHYDIAEGGGSADPRLPGILLVRAKLSNLGELQMPLPLIKLNLKDRWGDLVGGRTFTPPEYLSEGSAAEALLPGASVVVQLRVVDPGETANGFSLDACLSTNDGRLRCRYDSLTASND